MDQSVQNKKEEKEKMRRKRRKEQQKLKKKLDKLNLKAKRQAKAIVFSGDSKQTETTIVPINEKEDTIVDTINLNEVEDHPNELHDTSLYNSSNTIKKAVASSPYYETVLTDLNNCPSTLSTRKTLLSFYSRIFEEYEKYGSSLPEDEQKEWTKRCISIRKSLSDLSFYSRKAIKAIPERIINKLVSIRSALLRGDRRRADELYFDIDAGNIVVSNPEYFDLKMDCEALWKCITNIKRLMNFYCTTIIESNPNQI